MKQKALSIPEEWRDIYENNQKLPYQISNYGRVKNSETGEFRSPSITNGYYRIVLYYMDKPVAYSIHRLVAWYFVPNSDLKTKTQVNHIDGNKLNNIYTNLEWVTPKENKQHAITMGLDNPHHGHQKKGSESGVAKHTEEEAKKVCELLSKNYGPTVTAKMLNFDYEFVRSIHRGRAWVHISKNYKLPNLYKYFNKDNDKGKGSTTIPEGSRV